MELRQYLTPLRKWWWLLIATTLVSTISSYIAIQFQAPAYQSRATLLIGQAIEDPNPNNNSIFLTQQLSQSYIQIAQMESVRDRTMETLGLDFLPEYRVSTVPNTQLLQISVIDTSPVRAQAVANTLAEQLVLQSPTGSESDNQQRQAFIQEQLDTLEVKISETEDEIARLQQEIANMISARQIADAQTQIATLDSKLNTLQSNYASLLANTGEGAINTLRIIEPARLPQNPVSSNQLTTLLTGAAIGFTLAAGAAYLMEYLDNSLRTPEQIEDTLKLPIIGFINRSEQLDNESTTIPVASQPRSPFAESFRTLRANLEFAGFEKPVHTILVTSPSPGDGKTTISVNLAAILAQAGKEVVLVDADLRRPNTHNTIGLSEKPGLTDVFLNYTPLDEVLKPVTQKGATGLRVLTSGTIPPNPNELLSSMRMDQVLKDLKEMSEVIIIDSPPSLVADATILASKVDGVVLVIQTGVTPIDAAVGFLNQLDRAGARVLGVVMNNISSTRGYYYYYNRGSYSYYYGEPDKQLAAAPQG